MAAPATSGLRGSLLSLLTAPAEATGSTGTRASAAGADCRSPSIELTSLPSKGLGAEMEGVGMDREETSPPQKTVASLECTDKLSTASGGLSLDSLSAGLLPQEASSDLGSQKSLLAPSPAPTPPKASSAVRRLSLAEARRSVALSGTVAALGPADSEKRGGGGLGVLAATLVMFCNAFGCCVQMCPDLAKRAGWLGFLIALLLVGTVATTAEIATFKSCRMTKATCFADLCKDLPPITNSVTSFAQIGWGFVFIGFYNQFVFNGVGNVIWGCDVIEWQKSPAVSHRTYLLQAAPVYAGLLLANFAAGIPTNFSGAVARFIFSHFNLAVTWFIIIVSVVKGFMMMGADYYVHPVETYMVKPGGVVSAGVGIVQVVVIMCGAMFQSTAVPWLNSEMRPEVRARGAVFAPCAVASSQAFTFAAIGLLSFFATGADNMDVFRNSEGPDSNALMQRMLQVSVATMMFLTIPLASMPVKSEVYGCWQRFQGAKELMPLETAPLKTRLLINFSLVLYAATAPWLAGQFIYSRIYEIVCGTLMNWINMFSVVLIITYTQILPGRKRGEAALGLQLRVACVAFLSLLCFASSCYEIWKTFGGQDTCGFLEPGAPFKACTDNRVCINGLDAKITAADAGQNGVCKAA